MSSATRGSVRSRWRKPKSAVGSATCAPFTRSTTSPLRSPSFANRLSSRIWKRRKPAGRPSRTSATARSCVMRPLMVSTAPATSRRSTMKAFSAVRRMRSSAGAAAGGAGVSGGWGGRGRRELEDLLAAVALQGDAVPVDRRDARPAHLVADAVELLAVRRRVLDHGARLAALQADAPGAEPRGAARPVATAPRRVEDVALGDQRVVGQGSGRVRGDRGGGFGGRRGHVVDGRAETGGDPHRGQVRDQREEAELAGEPVTPDEPHGGRRGHSAGGREGA